jgi:hypothetical protein
MANEKDLQKALEDLTDAINDASTTKRKDSAEEREKKRNKGKLGENTKSIVKNTLGLVGLTTSMLTLKGMLGNVKEMNAKVSQSLGQLDQTTLGSRSVTERFNNASVGMTQAIKTFATATELGISQFSDGALRLSAQMKVLGLDNKQAMKLMRFNTQGLGSSSDSSAKLVDTLISTAAANKDSISGLVDAIASMKDALIGTSVELGPKAAENAQKIAAMMSQGNSELQQAASKFVTSFLTGTEGFQKAARLGVTFTGEESLDEMAVKFEQLLGAIQQLDPGGQAGSQYTLQAFEKQFGLSRQDFYLQRQIGTTLNDLHKTNTEQLAADVGKISIDQAYQNATYATQSLGLVAAENAAKGIAAVADWIGPWGTAVLGLLGSMLAFMGIGGIGNILSGGFRKIGGGIGKVGGLLKRGFGIIKNSLKWLGGKLLKGFSKLSPVKKVAGKAAARAGAKAAGKTIFKSFLKKIPVVGAVAGLGFAAARAMKGDWKGAMGEAASGLLSTIPGVGTAASLAVDAALAARDVSKAGQEAKEEAKKASKPDKNASREERYRQDMLTFEEMSYEQGQKSLQAQQETAEATKSIEQLNREARERPTSRGPEAAIVERLNEQILGVNKLIALTQDGNSAREKGIDATREAATNFNVTLPELPLSVRG